MGLESASPAHPVNFGGEFTGWMLPRRRGLRYFTNQLVKNLDQMIRKGLAQVLN